MERGVVFKKAVKGGGVVGVFVGGQYLTAIITQVILARILEPSHFGVLAFVLMLTLFFNNFANIHGDKYLVRESNISNEKVNNVFTLELIFAVILFFIIVGFSPFLMEFLGKSDQTIFVQFICLSFFYTPLSRLRALHERELSFYKANFPMLLGQFFGGILAVILAINGYGIWSLLWWKVSILFIEIIVLWVISSFRPKLSIDKTICKEIINYGKPLLFSSIIVYFVGNYDYAVVDRLTSVEQLGYYWLAFQISHYFLNARTAINKVVFPALSRLNQKNDRYKLFEAMTNLMSFLYLIPTIFVLIFGEELISIVFGIKWLPATPAFKVFFVIVLVKAIASNAGPLLHSEGNTMADFKLSLISFFIIIPTVYFGTLYGGILGASFGILIVGFISVICAYHMFVKPMTGHGFIYYLWKPLMIVFLLSLSLYLITWFELGIFFKLFFFLFSCSLTVFMFFNTIKMSYRHLHSNFFK